ncbi:MAG: DEAD/DEAH box helicase, partial [Planctomycetota bacterium]
MDTFEDLGLAPEIADALASEGVERPTALQETAVPVLKRGNNLLLAAGPGAGTLVAWAAPLLDRIPAEGQGAKILVLTTTAERAEGLAESLGRLAATTGHSLAALGSAWVLPDRADILCGTPTEVLRAVAGSMSLDGVQALVVDEAAVLESLEGLEGVERVLDYLPKEAQRVVTSLPVTPGIQDFMERHARRAATVPSIQKTGADVEAPTHRGDVLFRITTGAKEADLLDVVATVLEDARHALVFCRSEDRAADMGDILTLHGYMAGAPGDPDVPVWLGVDELEARAASKGHEEVTVVSCDVPADPDSLDRRHGINGKGVVIVLPREVAHLRDVARRTGYGVKPMPPVARGGNEEVQRLRDMVRSAIESEDIGPYLLALEPLFTEHDPAEVAAAAVALLRRKGPAAPAAAATAASAEQTPAAAAAWAKLFLSVGERDDLRPGDLLGAITG